MTTGVVDTRVAKLPADVRQVIVRSIDEAQADGLKAVKVRDGVLESEQIRRALDDWLNKKGVSVKAAPRRTRTRRKA